MKKRKVFIVAGLGHGDEGKGAMVDFLVRRHGASAVVRYTGGPQAAHYVIEQGGRWHCFSQFGSGTLVPGVMTHISRHVLIKPQNILAEEAELRSKGVTDALQRLTIDPECPIVTPYHAMIGQMLEIQRGAARHGSVGMGVGQAALDRKMKNPLAIAVKDTFPKKGLAKRLREHRDEKIARGENIYRESPLPEIASLLDHFKNQRDIKQLEEDYHHFATALPVRFISDQERMAELLVNNESLVFEGAQGALIDCDYGFWPHVTKTDTGINNARELLLPFIDLTDTRAIGILRAYSYRHGPGPLVTEDEALTRELPEVHNVMTEWQGRVRTGWPDLLTIRYALAIGSIDVIALTHVDRLSLLKSVKICTSYRLRARPDAMVDRYFTWSHIDRETIAIRGILPFKQQCSDNRTLLLERCRPLEFTLFPGRREDISTIRKAGELPSRIVRYLDFIRTETIPVGYISVGPTADDKIILPHNECRARSQKSD